MSLSLSGEALCSTSHAETDGQVARPWPQHLGVGDGHVKMLPVVLEVWVPGGLGGGREEGQRKEGRESGRERDEGRTEGRTEGGEGGREGYVNYCTERK